LHAAREIHEKAADRDYRHRLQGSYSDSGSGYEGNTVEWVAERPGLIGGGLEDLANYVAVLMNIAYAYNGNSYFYPASSPSGTTTYNITMTCPPWNPSSACTATTDLSWVALYGTYTLGFYDEGPAYQ